MESNSSKKPLLIKIAPDLSLNELEAIIDVAMHCEIDGIVATNTTIERPNRSHKVYDEAGGCSGLPLRQQSTEMIRHIYSYTLSLIHI